MFTPEDLKTGKDKLYLKIAQIADSGAGKTHNACTFPKVAFAITGPGEDMTFKTNPTLLKNIVGWDYFIPSDPKDTKNTLLRLDKYLGEIKTMALKGEVGTFCFDNLTYHARNLWVFIREHLAITHTNKDGEFDTRSAYGTLAQMLYEFVYMKLIPLPCHVIINMHLKLEDDKVMAKKADQSSPEVAAILGGFRNELNGLVDIVLYLSKQEKNGVYSYWARANKGRGKNAKSRIASLPAIINNISYQVIMDAINNTAVK